jgi:hypothetical protein
VYVRVLVHRSGRPDRTEDRNSSVRSGPVRNPIPDQLGLSFCPSVCLRICRVLEWGFKGGGGGHFCLSVRLSTPYTYAYIRCQRTRGAPTISRDKRRQPLKSGWEYSFHWKEKTGKVVECPYILYGKILCNFATLPVFSVSSLLYQPDNMCL